MSFKEGDEMQKYLPNRGSGAVFILLIAFLYNALLIALLYLTNSYEIATILRVALIALNIYQLYYLFICLSLYYVIENEELKIISLWGIKKVKIPLNEIKGYKTFSGKIRGIRLSGYGRDFFAIGRSVIEKIGTTYMYVTSSKNILYIKTDEINYGLSPIEMEKVINNLKNNNICETSWDYKFGKSGTLFNDKKFAIPFMISTLIIGFITINPVIQYLYQNIPAIMPLGFDAKFIPVNYGTGKQFAFKQMTHGLLNMAILLCMYYASYFIAKYDRKSAYKFICVPLVLSIIFLILQIRIFLTFR